MISFREGETVSYVGEEHDGLTLGSQGRLLAFASKTAGHVQWLTGPLRGSVRLLELDDLAPAAKRYTAALDGLEDSLEVGPVALASTRYVFDVEGSQGVLTRLASTGQLGSFEDIADDVLGFVQERIRSEATVREALADLDDDESDEVIHLASRVLLADAFGVADDD